MDFHGSVRALLSGRKKLADMNLIVCLDEGYGISFFGKRQSMDRVLREKALCLTEGKPLWMDMYSAGQFRKEAEQIIADNQYWEKMSADDWCFFELGDPQMLLPMTDRLAVFHWNREYPADKTFPMARIRANSTLCYTETFTGSSHENITLEVYQL